MKSLNGKSDSWKCIHGMRNISYFIFVFGYIFANGYECFLSLLLSFVVSLMCACASLQRFVFSFVFGFVMCFLVVVVVAVIGSTI